jgi:hydrogenase/urease accessory protein HupE
MTLALILWIALPACAPAHDPGLSTATARMHADRLEITLAMSLKDAAQLAPLDANGDGSITKEEFESEKAGFASAVSDKLHVEADIVLAKPATTFAWFEADNDVYCAMTFSVPNLSTLTIQSRFLEDLPPSHRQFFTLELESGAPRIERLLSRSANSVTVELGSAPANAIQNETTGRKSFIGFLALGVEHILTGYDHLLFLFALLIVTSRFMPALQIITCFTIAHSITLAVATLNLIEIPSRIVEPLIAASIIYVGMENIFSKGAPRGRGALTFAFGLIHGLGFASVLRELGVGTNGSGLAMPLISFNLGVELGQIAVAAIILPVIWKLRAQPLFPQRWIPASSLIVMLLGSFWFVQRVWF